MDRQKLLALLLVDDKCCLQLVLHRCTVDRPLHQHTDIIFLRRVRIIVFDEPDRDHVLARDTVVQHLVDQVALTTDLDPVRADLRPSAVRTDSGL